MDEQQRQQMQQQQQQKEQEQAVEQEQIGDFSMESGEFLIRNITSRSLFVCWLQGPFVLLPIPAALQQLLFR